MKKSHIIFSLSVFLLFISISGCEDTEDIFEHLSVNPENLSENQFWQTEADALRAVYGMYGYLSVARNLGAHGTGTLILRGDESTNTSDYGTEGQYNNFYTANYYSVQEPWAFMYTAAFAATDILDKVPDIEFQDDELKNAYLGEAYFIRAFAHFYLLINYRNIPLLVEPSDSFDDFVRGQVEPDAAWDQIISDLENAKNLLPNKDFWTNEDLGRASVGSAAALLGKAYLFRSGIETHYGNGGDFYTEATNEFNDIINGVYGEYRLISNYDDNFGVENENNDESLFEVQFKGDRENRGFNPGFEDTGLFNDNRGFSPPGYRSSTGECAIHDWLYETFVASVDENGNTDPRMFGTLIFDDSAPEINVPDSDSDGEPDYQVTGVAGMTWDEMYPSGDFGEARAWAAPYKATNRKWLDLTLPTSGDFRFGDSRAQGANYRYIRYADVLLMYAEAVLMGGEQGSLSSLQAVNQVRERVNMPLRTGPLTMDDIENERILELSMEGHRFYDLLRWGEVADRHEFLFENDPNFKQAGFGRGANSEGFVRDKHEWLPIPVNEVESNPEIVQNPGW